MITNEIRLDIAKKIITKFVERGSIQYPDVNNDIEKYTTLSIKIADELIKKIYDTEKMDINIITYLDKAREDVELLLTVEDNEDTQMSVLLELVENINSKERVDYLRYLNTLLLNQLLNNLTNIGDGGEKKVLNIRKILVNKVLPKYI